MPAPMTTARWLNVPPGRAATYPGALSGAGCEGPRTGYVLGPLFPSARQLVLICLVWAVVAWYTVAVWAVRAAHADVSSAFAHYYAIRAPLAGAVMGLLWSPVFALGYHPRRLRWAHGLGRDLFAEDSPLRHALRFLRGAALGQVVGATISVLILFVWPNEMQNTRWDALKWAAFTWKLYWYLLAPAAALAGGLSVWMAIRHCERPGSLEP